MCSNILNYELNLPKWNLNNLSLKALDKHIQNLVKTERKIMDEVLKGISEMDLRKGYLELGCSSLFAYLVRLGYSESAVQRRITATRVMRKMNSPTRQTVEKSLKEGSLNLSQLTQVKSLFDYLEKIEREGEIVEIDTAIPKMIHEMRGQSARKTEALVQKAIDAATSPAKRQELNRPQKPRVTKQATGQVKITLTLSSELNKKLQRVLEIKSHAIPDGNVLSLFEKLLDAEIKKFQGSGQTKQISKETGNEPIKEINKEIAVEPSNETGKEASKEIGKEASQKSAAATEVAPTPAPVLLQKKINHQQEKAKSSLNTKFTSTDPKCKRKHISIPIKRRVYQNAGYQCEYLSPITGERCGETKFLTIDHLHPVINWPI